ncbi:MAG: hypothetical protein HW383_320 [Candidatus Magasanikbacteria bacterium]|nr:hypothetical protein [Candidatus Magasanikbacteria bacterium]
MNILDIILLIVLFGFALFGFWFGIIHTIGSLSGAVLGAFIASHYGETVARWIVAGNEPSLPMKITGFIIAFVVVNRLIGFLFWLAEKFFNIAAKLPFLTSANRLLGALLGILEGILVVGLTLVFALQNPLTAKTAGRIAASPIARTTMNTAQVLYPLVPRTWKKIKELVPKAIDYGVKTIDASLPLTATTTK